MDVLKRLMPTMNVPVGLLMESVVPAIVAVALAELTVCDGLTVYWRGPVRATLTVPGATPAPVSDMPGEKAEPRCRKAGVGA